MTTDLITVAEKIYGVNPKTNSRKRPYVYARIAVMVELKKNPELTLKDIASVFDKDHATVIHSLKQHQNLLKDTDYMWHYNRFLREIGYDVPAVEIKKALSVKVKDLEKHQPLFDLIKDVPDDMIDSVYIKLDAIVRMSKVRHLIK